jgi:hypothetical protein
MEATVHACHRLAHSGPVGDVADHDLRRCGRVRALAGREVVKDANPVPARDQGIGQMRADEAAATGDKKRCHRSQALVGPSPALVACHTTLC